MLVKPSHPNLNGPPPISAQQPHIVCHNRAFRIHELPEDYPYQLEPSSESSANINIPYHEFRGQGPPPTDIGNLGDVYLDLIDVEAYALYALTKTGWKIWDPLPTPIGTIPPVSELLAHPDSEKLNRYLWCDGYQIGWYALSSLGGKRSRMRQDGIYLTKDGLSEELNSSAAATEVIRRMLEAEDTAKLTVMRRSRKRPLSPLKGSELTPQRKKARLSTNSMPSIKSISKTDVSTERPLSWKIRFTPLYSTPSSLSAQPRADSVTPGIPNGRTSGLAPDGDEHDTQDIEGSERIRSQQVKALIEERSLYEEENQRLKERVLQLTAQTDSLRDTITKTSCVDAIQSLDGIQRNSLSRSTPPQEALNPIVISSTDMLKTTGVELKKARLETQKIRLELEGVRAEADLQHNRTKARLSSALAAKDKEIETLRGKCDDRVSRLELNLLSAAKRLEQEQAARSLAERKFSDLATRVKEFKDTVLT